MAVLASIPSFEEKDLAKFEQEIIQKRPLLGQVINEYGNMTLEDYIFSTLSGRIPTPPSSRRDEFIISFKKILAERLGLEIANEIATQLLSYYVVSTADHHAPLCAPFSLNSNVIASLGRKKDNESLFRYFIVLSCASVSLNNEDFPRGLLFHSLSTGTFDLQRLSFLPSNAHSSVVYGFRPYTQADVAKVLKFIDEKIKNGFLLSEQGKLLHEIVLNLYGNERVLKSQSFSEQITQTNFALWRKYFPVHSESSSPAAPDLVYVEQEKVVVQLLLDHHIFQDTLIHRMIFNPDYNEKLIQPLYHAMDEFVRQGGHSTDLFWGISDKHYRIPLHFNGKEYVSSDNSFSVPAQPEALSQALKEGRIFPNLLMVFTVLFLYYGLNSFGGFGQMSYFQAMQRIYNKLALDDISSNGNPLLYLYGLRALFLHSDNDSTLAYGPDLLLYGHSDNWNVIRGSLSSITLHQALKPSLKEIHSIVCGA